MPHEQHTLAPATATPSDGEVSDASSGAAAESTGPLAAVGHAVTAVIATLMGLAPHVLHHLGLFAGAAFVVGVGGNLLFGAVGLVVSIPLLRRLHRRFGTWRAPAIAVAVFTVMFSLSAFVVGPALSSPDPVDDRQPLRTPGPAEHSAHHSD